MLNWICVNLIQRHMMLCRTEKCCKCWGIMLLVMFVLKFYKKNALFHYCLEHKKIHNIYIKPTKYYIWPFFLFSLRSSLMSFFVVLWQRSRLRCVRWPVWSPYDFNQQSGSMYSTMATKLYKIGKVNVTYK